MKITVILCTFNRCQSLAKALESVAASQLPISIEWEVLVVDNNSSDQTREVVEEFCRRYIGRFRYLFEPQSGKSYALNAGVREARGEIVAFIDDDVTVHPAWLRNLTAVLYDRGWAGVGGRVLPEWECPPPPWLPLDGPNDMRGMLALFDFGDNPTELRVAPIGANMAYQKRMFEKYGGFRTDLGPTPSGDIPRFNEDTEFGRRLMAAGERLGYEPSAVAHHPVPRSRLKKEYFEAWWFSFGRSSVREIGNRPDIWGIPRPYLTILKMGALLVGRALRWLVALRPQRRFYRKFFVWMTAGEIVETYRLLLARKNARQLP